MDFDFNKPRSILEFLEDYKQFEKQLQDKGLNEAEIEEKCSLYSSFEFSNIKYDKYRIDDEYSLDNLQKTARYIQPILVALKRSPYERGIYLSKMPSFAIPQVITACKSKFDKENKAFTEADMAQSFVASADKIAEHYFNQPEYLDDSGWVDVNKLTYIYPESIVVVRNDVAKSLASSKTNNAKQIAVVDPDCKQIQIIKVNESVVGNGLDNESLSYFDILVFEAIMSLFKCGNKNISLPMIYKMLMGRLDARMTQEKIHNYKASEILSSIQKLLRYKVYDKTIDKCYSDSILKGMIHLSKGRFYLEVGGESDYYKDMVYKHEIEEIQLKETHISDKNYNASRIALKSYIVHEIVAAKNKGKTHISIKIDNIVKFSLLEAKKQISSFRKTQRDNVPLLLQEFVNNGFISGFKTKDKIWTTVEIDL